jgi:hypothetical protein
MKNGACGRRFSLYRQFQNDADGCPLLPRPNVVFLLVHEGGMLFVKSTSRTWNESFASWGSTSATSPWAQRCFPPSSSSASDSICSSSGWKGYLEPAFLLAVRLVEAVILYADVVLLLCWTAFATYNAIVALRHE